jgi:hypothetical protein
VIAGGPAARTKPDKEMIMSTPASRGAGQARPGLAVRARDGPAFPRPAAGIRPGPLRRALQWCREWYLDRLERRFHEGISGLDDRMLRDIGIQSVELPEALARGGKRRRYVLDHPHRHDT